MSKGYYIVEPLKMSSIYADPKNYDTSVAVFYWLIQEIRLNLAMVPEPDEISVIQILRYGGEYIAIGIHYKQIIPENLSVVAKIAEFSDMLLSTRPISEFLAFLKKEDRDWGKITEEILSEI